MTEKKQAGEKGPDNNKRLAELEAGVSALALAIAGAGIELKDGQDPIEQAIAITDSFKEKMLQLAALSAFLLDNSDEPLDRGPVAAAISTIEKLSGNGATAGEIAAIARAEAAEKRVAELEAALEAAGEVPGGAPTPAPEPKERPAAARDVGPSFGQLDAAELGEALDSGEDLELVFSNGEYEIVDFEPVKVTAKDLPIMAGKRQVAQPLFVRGGGNDDRIHGAGLLQGGVQIAYCEFPSPVPIEKGQERRFERAISFS